VGAALLVALVAGVAGHARPAAAATAGGEIPASVRDLLAAYEAAWENSDVFGLLALGQPGSPVFQDLLDDERLDRVVESAVVLSDVLVTPHERLDRALTVRFRRVQEEVFNTGTVTRGVADIAMIVREDPGGARILDHRVVPVPGAEDYRPEDPTTWGGDHGTAETAFHLGYRAAQEGDCVGALEQFAVVLQGQDRWIGTGKVEVPRYRTGANRFLAQVHHFAAVCELRRGDRERAIALAQRAVELTPSFPLALNFLAERAAEAGDLAAAATFWRQSLAAWREQPEIEARLVFHEKALQFYPDPDLRALYLSVRGLPPAKAAVRLQRLLRRSPDDPETRRRLAICYLQSMQPEKAKEVLHHNEYLHPHDLETQYLLARTYVQLQRLEDAAAMLQRIWARSPGYEDSEVLLAEVFAALRRYPDAVGVLQDSLGREADDALANYKLAVWSRRLGRLQEARSHLRRAAELRPPAAVRRAIYEGLQTW
jgi:tetratricopeptide (TPR) repeat protein